MLYIRRIHLSDTSQLICISHPFRAIKYVYIWRIHIPDISQLMHTSYPSWATWYMIYVESTYLIPHSKYIHPTHVELFCMLYMENLRIRYLTANTYILCMFSYLIVIFYRIHVPDSSQIICTS